VPNIITMAGCWRFMSANVSATGNPRSKLHPSKRKSIERCGLRTYEPGENQFAASIRRLGQRFARIRVAHVPLLPAALCNRCAAPWTAFWRLSKKWAPGRIAHGKQTGNPASVAERRLPQGRHIFLSKNHGAGPRKIS